ncbi:alpha/beta fold hydrolase [Cupriavidus consociatus]|uniref:alpha/beta fold hydrolase n=1 Tax=Cupriavidus consociatus TaxID=2821357 RepID=UPI001AE13EF8|nr:MULTISPECIES: alpha/beta hydrolase [unclassified Cupriavidus]MBP0622328.1 alpha/beta hydrolase [Cupriavidus sp. LEh25]MDK2659009.1 alpha/beta hydrolase [Cupriavidus sp. LEh21]
MTKTAGTAWSVSEVLRGRSERRTVVAGGLAWSVLEAGQGRETLVLLPGTLGTVEVFYKQLLKFSETCRVVVLGYPGASNPEAMAASFRELLKELDIDKAHFVGSSLGGYWLQVFLRGDTARVKSLVLGNTFLDPARLRFIRMFSTAFLAENDPDAVKDAWLGFVQALPNPELKDFMLEAAGARQSAAELDGRSRTIAVANPVAPLDLPSDRITLIWCEDDKVIHAETWKELVSAYPDARRVELSTGGHYPHLLVADDYNDEIQYRVNCRYGQAG